MKMKANRVIGFAVLLALFAFAACDMGTDNGKKKGNEETAGFEASMLGISPGLDTTGLMFNWYSTEDEGDKSLVKIFDAATDTLVKEVTGTSGEASAGNLYHKASATGLTAGTAYTYSVSNDGTEWSKKYNYKAPAAGNFKFASLGDPQITIGNVDPTSKYPAVGTPVASTWKETMIAIAKENVSFIASVGDSVDDNDGNEEEYKRLFAPAELRSLPFATVMGNHDENPYFQYHFNAPGNDITKPQAEQFNYYYLYNNVLFIALNNGTFVTTKEEAAVFIDRFNDVIDEAKTANAGKYDWIVVQHHKSTNSVAQHLADPDIQYFVEAGFEKMMDDQGVDVVLAGHDHVYARSYVMKNRARVDGADVTQKDVSVADGTLYITLTSAAGLKYYDVFAPMKSIYYDMMVGYGMFPGRTAGHNTQYPILADGSVGTEHYSKEWIDAGNEQVLPLSTRNWAQNKKPGYAIINVSGSTKMDIVVYELSDGEPKVVDQISVRN